MTEITELTRRLLETESRLDALTDSHMAMRIVVFQTLQLLDEGNVLRMQAVADACEASSAFGKAGFDVASPKLLPKMIESLREIGDALEKRRAGLG